MENTTDYLTPELVKTLPGLFWKRVERSPDKVAYRFYDRIKEQWQELTWGAMGARVGQWCAALAREALAPGDRVALMVANGPDWAGFDLAALSHGLVVVPLFANDRPQNIAYILEKTQTKLLLCPGLAYWNDLEPVLHRLTGIQRIITLELCKVQEQDFRIACSSDWLEAAPQRPSHLPQNSDDLATIVFTSGTTGPPKGVMLSHRNILDNCLAGLRAVTVYPDDIFLSFLPLSHMLERTVGYYLPIMAGATVAYSRSIPYLTEDLTIIRPTVLIAVPRIFERIYASIQVSLANRSFVARQLFTLAAASGWRSFLYRQGRAGWHPLLLLQPLLRGLVAGKVQARLGGRIRAIISGGAPLAPEIARLFIGLDLPMLQGYGLTETSPVVSVNRLEDNDPEGVGPPLPGIEVSLDRSGELLVRGSCVMLGYWQDEEATRKTIDPGGWLHTGDKAAINNDHLSITGRLKEILVLSNGEKVPPVDLEMAIMLDPLFDQVMVIGENKPYLTLLAVVDPKQWQELCAHLNIPTGKEQLRHEKVLEEALARVEKQLQSFPGFMGIEEITLTLEPWTVENGLLTPTLKSKREAIADQYKNALQAMYTENGQEIARINETIRSCN